MKKIANIKYYADWNEKKLTVKETYFGDHDYQYWVKGTFINTHTGNKQVTLALDSDLCHKLVEDYAKKYPNSTVWDSVKSIRRKENSLSRSFYRRCDK